VGCPRTTSIPALVAVPKAVVMRGADENGARAPCDGGSCHRMDSDHGPLRWSLPPYHLWHRIRCHLRLLLRLLWHALRDSFRGSGLAVRSWPWSRPDNRFYSSGACGRSSCARRSGCAGGRGAGQQGASHTEVSKHPCRNVWLVGWNRCPLGPNHFRRLAGGR
jgi:hypothetical protein